MSTLQNVADSPGPSPVEQEERNPSVLGLSGNSTRAQASFIILTLSLMFLMLIMFQPQQQEGLLCGSNQAQRLRLTYAAVEPRTHSEIQCIQAGLKKFDYIGRLSHGQQHHAEQSAAKEEAASGNSGEATTAEPRTTVATPSETKTGTTPVHPPAPSQPRRIPHAPSEERQPQFWERKSFTAPWEEGHEPHRPPEDMQDEFRKWETEFQKALKEHDNDIPRTFHDWIAPAVDKLDVEPDPIATVDQAVVMLDGREDPMLIFALKHAFNMLGPGWGLVIFHSPDNEKWLIDQLKIRPGEPGQHIQLQRVHPLEKTQANSLALSTVFYERIGVETLLLIQPDAFMLRSPWLGTQNDRSTWDHLLSSYGFIGAPWGWCKEEWCTFGGNGGASLRKRSVMRDVISELRCGDWECARHDLFRDQEHNPDDWWRTEDTFIAKVLHQHRKRWEGRLPTQRQSAEFSLEHLAVPEAQPFFVHKVWTYQPESRWLPLLAHVRQYYPELH